MRSFTKNEVVVVSSLLANSDSTLQTRIRESRLPRRTFEVARRRLMESGVLQERYVPNPASIGIGTLTFVIAHPFQEVFQSVHRRWLDARGNVLLWRTPELLFGVFLKQAEAPNEGQVPLPPNSSNYSRITVLDVPPRADCVPIYFDFEGVWSRVSKTASATYPRSIVRSQDSSPGTPRQMSKGLRRALEAAASATPQSLDASESPGLLSAWSRKTTLRKLIDADHLTRRVFLSPGPLAGYQGWSSGQLILIHGRVLPGRSPVALQRELLDRGRAFPFLFATNGSHVLVGGIGLPSHRTQAGALDLLPSRMRIFQSYLDSIVVHRSALETLDAANNHQYGRAISDFTPDV